MIAGMTLHARDTVTRQLVTLSLSDAASADHLPTGTLENKRYACLSCHQPMSLSRRTNSTSSYRPRFNHGQRNNGATDTCVARAAVQQQVEADVQVVIDLQERLAKAWPGTSTLIECLTPTGHDSPAPPVIVARDGDQVVVIDCPHGPLDEPTVRHRIKAVRDQFGAQAAHVWFFAEDPHHFRQGDLKDKAVRPHGAQRSIRHRRVRPTERQLQIIEAGGAVYWLNGGEVLVPYGGHDFQHPPRRGEDWTGEAARYRYDWRISQPRPAPGAQWWGLVPIGLSSLRRGRVAFHPAEAYAVMERLERSQPARWSASRRRAREQFDRQLSPAPPEATRDDSQSLAGQRAENDGARAERPAAADGPAIPGPDNARATTSPAQPPFVPLPPPYPPAASLSTPRAEIPEQQRRGLRGFLRGLVRRR